MEDHKVPRVQRSHRVLYVDESNDSRQAERMLDMLSILYARVKIRDPRRDPRRLTRMPAFSYMSRGGFSVTKQGLADIEAAAEAIKSDFLLEAEERKAERPEEHAGWDQEQIAQLREIVQALRP